jgi:hypothetical protein
MRGERYIHVMHPFSIRYYQRMRDRSIFIFDDFGYGEYNGLMC